MVYKVTFVGFRGADRPLPIRPCYQDDFRERQVRATEAQAFSRSL